MTLPRTTLSCVHQGLPQTSIDSRLHPSASYPYRDLLRLEERPLPKLGFGMALIRVEGAPVNPSDQLYIQGKYGVLPKAGDVPGFEGCGTVLAANVGPYGWWLKGKRVSFGSQDGNGAWSQYVVVSAFSCIPVSRRLPVEAAASLIVNPMTAIGLLARAKKHGTRAIVVNAAGSALGKFLLALAKQQGIKFIGLVRRDEVRKELLGLGADEVLNTNDPELLDKLHKISRQHEAHVLLDAVAGRQTAALMQAMPDRSLAIVYGKLEEAPQDFGSQVSPVATDADGLVFRKQRVEGYWLTHELHGIGGIFTPLIRARQISQLYRSGVFKTGAFATTSLEELIPCLDSEMNQSKLLLRTDVNSSRTKSEDQKPNEANSERQLTATK